MNNNKKIVFISELCQNHKGNFETIANDINEQKSLNLLYPRFSLDLIISKQQINANKGK